MTQDWGYKMKCTGFCRECAKPIDRGPRGNRLRCPDPCAKLAARRQRNYWGRENRARLNAQRRKKLPYAGSETKPTNHGERE